jgi:hypothetical protein
MRDSLGRTAEAPVTYRALILLLVALVAPLGAQQPEVDPEYRVKPTVDSSAPDHIYIPKNLDDALAELDRMLTPAFVAEFRDSANAPVMHHFGLGLWMRNNWRLWAGSRLAKYFNCIGIFHPDDMSGIVLKSFWLRLNNRPIDLEQQVESYQAYWRRQGTDSSRVRPPCEGGRPN